MNQSETAVLEGLARERGLRIVDFKTPADIAVINSCTVTERGDKDARAAVRRAVQINPRVRIAIIGCQAQVQKEKLLALPNVSWVIGTAKKMDLLDIIAPGAEGPAAVIAPVIRRKSFTLPLTKAAGHRTRANLKIQDGCDNFCAYCEIPFARGRSRSRVFKNVLAEGQALAAAGHKEIVLTGVNVADYHDEGRDLLKLVEALEDIEGIERIRISSIEDGRLALALTRFMHPPHKLCRFLHIPLQSGSNRILKRMGRAYLTEDFGNLIQQISKKVPGVMLGTDVIVGFPGETEGDFDETLRFLKGLPIHYCHVFSYSHRSRARSRTFKGEVPERIISERSRALRALSEEKRGAFLQGLLGVPQRVLFERIKNNFWIGYTDNYVTIKTTSEQELKNCFAQVVPVKVEGLSLVGRLRRKD